MRHSAKHVGLRNQQPKACTVHYLLCILTPFPYKPNQHANLNPLSPMHTPNYPHALQPTVPIDPLYPPTCPDPNALFNLHKQYLLTPQKPTDHTTHPFYLITIQSHPIPSLVTNHNPTPTPTPPFPAKEQSISTPHGFRSYDNSPTHSHSHPHQRKHR